MTNSATLCYLKRFSKNCEITIKHASRKHIYSLPPINLKSPECYLTNLSAQPTKTPEKRLVSKEARGYIRCATHSPPTSWKPAMTSVRFRCLWAIHGLPQPSHSTASQQNFNLKTFRIIHPFHPYRDIEFEIDNLRRVPGGCRVFFLNKKGRKSSVPLDWTDIGPKDPFVAVSAGRALFRVEDLLDLVRLIGEINSANRK